MLFTLCIYSYNAFILSYHYIQRHLTAGGRCAQIYIDSVRERSSKQIGLSSNHMIGELIFSHFFNVNFVCYCKICN